MKTITVIGGGFSGQCVAINIIRQSINPCKILVIEQNPLNIAGKAYSCNEPSLLLNVPAGKMSLFTDQPDHFTNWLRSNGHNYLNDEFVPRNIYGQYVKETFQLYRFEALAKGIHVDELLETVIDVDTIDDGTFQVHLQNHQSMKADYVIMALGNVQVKGKQFQNLFSKTWIDLPVYLMKDSVLLIGTSLTMIDCFIQIHQKNPNAKIFALSRNGFIPKAHDDISGVVPIPSRQLMDASKAVEVLRAFLNMVEQGELHGYGLNNVVDSLRVVSEDVWNDLDSREQQKFLKHLASYWTPIRHRIPMQYYQKLQNAIEEGKLEILSGRLTKIESNQGGLIEYIDKHSKERRTLQVDQIINCTGFSGNLKNSENELLKRLIQKETVKVHFSKQGIMVDDSFQVFNKKGRVVQNLFALGPLLKGQFFETTAVREIRAQAEAIASVLCKDLQQVVPPLKRVG